MKEGRIVGESISKAQQSMMTFREGIFTVNEMIGVIKWNREMYDIVDLNQDYLEELEEWQELGSGDTTVENCREVMKC